MTGKQNFVVFVSLGVVFGVAGFFQPWLIIPSTVALISVGLANLKQASERAILEDKIEKLEIQAKKTQDEIALLGNKMSMYIGVRK